MCIIKEQIDENGTASLFHVVTNISFYENRMVCTLRSYASRELIEEDSSLYIEDYFFSITDEEKFGVGPYTLAYNKILMLPKWVNASLD